jgi:hypothetical protein
MEIKMEIKISNHLSKEDYYKVTENLLVHFGYYTEEDPLNSESTTDILRKTYKKIKPLYGEPSIIILLNGFILSKIWLERGRVSRIDGGPAEISYDESGILEKSWYLNGRCINDEIAFVCLKHNKDKNEINNEDISFIRELFRIK